jgi:hypothetical protein
MYARGVRRRRKGEEEMKLITVPANWKHEEVKQIMRVLEDADWATLQTLIVPAGVDVKVIQTVQGKTCLWCRFPIPVSKDRCDNCGGHA